MSIIIKGLDLPPVSDTNGIINLSIDCYGQVVVSNTHPTKILKAEQIPKHGPLIDLDALNENAVELMDEFYTNGEYAEERGVNMLRHITIEAPIIIEAEDKE